MTWMWDAVLKVSTASVIAYWEVFTCGRSDGNGNDADEDKDNDDDNDDRDNKDDHADHDNEDKSQQR